MRAYWIIMLCISLFDLRGQRIAKVGYPSGAGSVTQDGITLHFFFDDPVSGFAGLEDNTRMFVGFLDPVFSSFSTPVGEIRPDRFKVFPNPFSENIFIHSSFPGENIRFSLSDLQGRAILQGIAPSENGAIQTQFLYSGVYILSLGDRSGHFALYKLIKL